MWVFAIAAICCLHGVLGQEVLREDLFISAPEEVREQNLVWASQVEVDTFRDSQFLVTNAITAPEQAMQGMEPPEAMTYVYEIVANDNGTLTADLRLRLEGFGLCVAISQNYGMATHSNGTVAIFTGNSSETWQVIDTVDTGIRAIPPDTFGNICSLSLSYAVIIAQKFDPTTGGQVSAIWMRRPEPGVLECGSTQNQECVTDDELLAGLFLEATLVVRLSSAPQVMLANSEQNSVSVHEIVDDGSQITTKIVLEEQSSIQSQGIVEKGADYKNGTLVFNSKYIADVNEPDTFISLDSVESMSHIRATDNSIGMFVGVIGSTLDVSAKEVKVFSVSGDEFEESYKLVNSNGNDKNGDFVGPVSSVALGGTFVVLGAYDDTITGNYSLQGVHIWNLPVTLNPSPPPPPEVTGTPTATPTTTPTATPTATPNPPNTDSETPLPTEEESELPTSEPCFAADSTVVVLKSDGSERSVQMSELQPGDAVESFDKLGRRIFSEVIFLQHDKQSRLRDLLVLEAVDTERHSHVIRVHKGHYLVKNVQPTQFVLAADLEVGDEILIMAPADRSMTASIKSIKSTQSAVRNVVTMNDLLVVDGICASSYTNVLYLRPSTQALLLSPLKLLYTFGLRKWPESSLMQLRHAASSVFRV